MPSSNRLFDRLSAAARERLRPHTELVHLSRGRVLHDIGEPPRHAFLLLDGMVSLMPFTEDGNTVEVATVCNDGFVGSLVLAGIPSPYQAIVQLPGAAYRINGEAFHRECRRGEDLQSLALAYVDDVMRQVVQSAICLPGWTVVVIGAKHSAGFDACQAAFDAHARQASAGIDRTADLAWYFATRRMVEQGDLSQICVRDIGRLRELRQTLATPRHERLYARWLATRNLELDSPVAESSTTSSGRLVVEPLPFAYEQFGSLPGVA